MKLKIKFLKWSAGFPVVMLKEDTAKKIGLSAKDRISIKTLSSKPKSLSTIVDTIDNHIIKGNEIAVSSEMKKIMDLKNNQKVDVGLSSEPESLGYIKKKLNKKILSGKEINSIIEDVVNNSLSEAEIALFVSAMYENGMNIDETVNLIKSILKSGNTLKLKNKFIADKHSIGGIPGNRTTPIVVSICAAAGLVMPKSSSRAITTAAGTADVIEAIANVEFTIPQLKKILHKTNACMVWGGALGMVPADDKIIQVEKMLKIDPQSQLLASIMAKKLAAGSKYVVIDIPYGKTAKVSKKEAKTLKKKFKILAKKFGIKLKVVLTKGNQPIGKSIGPMLELKDILNILDPDKHGPIDLEKKSLFIAGQLLELTGKAKKFGGTSMARDILYSGKALKKFKQIISAQGGSLNRLRTARFHKDILAKKSGKIIEFDNKKINFLARVAGCPNAKSAGIYLHKKLGEKFAKGEPILTIHSESQTRLKEAVKYYFFNKPIKIK